MALRQTRSDAGTEPDRDGRRAGASLLRHLAGIVIHAAGGPPVVMMIVLIGVAGQLLIGAQSVAQVLAHAGQGVEFFANDPTFVYLLGEIPCLMIAILAGCLALWRGRYRAFDAALAAVLTAVGIVSLVSLYGALHPAPRGYLFELPPVPMAVALSLVSVPTALLCWAIGEALDHFAGRRRDLS